MLIEADHIIFSDVQRDFFESFHLTVFCILDIVYEMRSLVELDPEMLPVATLPDRVYEVLKHGS